MRRMIFLFSMFLFAATLQANPDEEMGKTDGCENSYYGCLVGPQKILASIATAGQFAWTVFKETGSLVADKTSNLINYTHGKTVPLWNYAALELALIGLGFGVNIASLATNNELKHLADSLNCSIGINHNSSATNATIFSAFLNTTLPTKNVPDSCEQIAREVNSLRNTGFLSIIPIGLSMLMILPSLQFITDERYSALAILLGTGVVSSMVGAAIIYELQKQLESLNPVTEDSKQPLARALQKAEESKVLSFTFASFYVAHFIGFYFGIYRQFLKSTLPA